VFRRVVEFPKRPRSLRPCDFAPLRPTVHEPVGISDRLRRSLEFNADTLAAHSSDMTFHIPSHMVVASTEDDAAAYFGAENLAGTYTWAETDAGELPLSRAIAPDAVDPGIELDDEGLLVYNFKTEKRVLILDTLWGTTHYIDLVEGSRLRVGADGSRSLARIDTSKTRHLGMLRRVMLQDSHRWHYTGLATGMRWDEVSVN